MILARSALGPEDVHAAVGSRGTVVVDRDLHEALPSVLVRLSGRRVEAHVDAADGRVQIPRDERLIRRRRRRSALAIAILCSLPLVKPCGETVAAHREACAHHATMRPPGALPVAAPRATRLHTESSGS